MQRARLWLICFNISARERDGGGSLLIGDLIFLATFLMIVAGVVLLAIALTTRHSRFARGVLLVGVTWLLIYAVALFAVSWVTPQQTLAIGQEHCFDEMCFSVTQARTANAMTSQDGVSHVAHGTYYIVTMQLRNKARWQPQKPDSPGAYLVDQSGHTYQPARDGQQVIGQEARWDERLQPDERQMRDLVFDVPSNAGQPSLVITEGGWPSPLVIGDENSPFHQKTAIRLTQ